MLADGCEAAARANRPESPDQLNDLVRRVIADRVVWGQLDECPLTIAELDEVRESFAATLQGLYHPRLRYPGQEATSDATVKVVRSNGDAKNGETTRKREGEANGTLELKD
jgi:membrane-associated HD superfamily phosphohydrolase